jgi:WD40 repeat protein
MVKKYVLLMLFVVVPVCSMDQTFKIYGTDGETSAFEISADVLKLSKTLADLIEDLGGSTESAIPISNFSTATLKNLVEMLKLYDGSANSLEQMRNQAQNYSISELIEMSNCANYLSLSDVILNVFSDVIRSVVNKKKFKSSRHIPAGELGLDFTRHYVSPEMMSEITSYIKTKMLEKNMSDRIQMRVPVNNAKTYAPTGIFLNNDAWIAMSTVSGRQNEGNILIFDAVNNEQLYTLPLNFNATQLIAHKNSYLVCREHQGERIRIFNIQDPHNIKYYDYTLSGIALIKSMEFSPEGSFLVLTHNHKKIVVIDMNAIDWSAMPVSFDITKVSFLDAPVGHSGQDKIFFSDDSACMVASVERKFINLSRANCVTRAVTYMAIPEEKAGFRCCGFSKDGKRLAVLSELGKKLKIVVFNTNAMEKIIEFNGPAAGTFHPISIQFSPDGLWLMCTKHNSVSLYNSVTGELLGKVDGLLHNKSVCMSSDSNKILFAGSNSTVMNNYFGTVYTVLTPQEKVIIQKISRCSLDQLQLIRNLCYTLVVKGSVEINEDSTSYTLFTSLDEDIQQLLQRIGVKIISTSKLKKLLSRPKKG